MSEITFSELDIRPEVQKALLDMNFKVPTEIQERAIKALSKTKRDFVGQAQTGTGKTASFVIPLLENVTSSKKNVQALILAPTRELAAQVEQEVKKLSKYTEIRSACVYGGAPIDKQIDTLRHEYPHIVVGTPGRVIDLIKRNALRIDQTNFCVLDEADEMLTMGFFEDVELILSKIKVKKQLMMFSATMPREIEHLIRGTFNDPHIERIKRKSLSNDDIEQKYFVVRDKHLKEALSRLIDEAEDVYGIVFCKTKIQTKEVADDLKKRGHNVDVLNGDMGQADRDLAMERFKTKKVSLLVCTDVAARGIDVDNLTHVFNYGAPRDNESYVHRIGRTGRAGMKGKAYTIIGPREKSSIQGLQKHINKKIELSKLPSVESLKMNMVKREVENASFIVQAIKEKGEEFHTDSSFELVNEAFKELNRDELMKLMFVWKFNKDMRHLNNIADIETDHSTKKSKPGKRRSKSQAFGKKRREFKRR